MSLLFPDADELYEAANEVATLLRRKLGDKEYTAKLSECQKESSTRFEKRKGDAKILAVADPAAAIARKKKNHERKKLARKRKIDQFKPYRAWKRMRQEEHQDDDGDSGEGEEEW